MVTAIYYPPIPKYSFIRYQHKLNKADSTSSMTTYIIMVLSQHDKSTRPDCNSNVII